MLNFLNNVYIDFVKKKHDFLIEKKKIERVGVMFRLRLLEPFVSMVHVVATVIYHVKRVKFSCCGVILKSF